MNKFKPLNTLPLKKHCKYDRAARLPEIVHLEDPAIHALIDFRYVSPAVIKHHRTLAEIRVDIKNCGSHAFLITDDNNKVVGFLSSEDVLGEKPVKIINDRHVNANEVLAEHLMTDIEKMVAINIQDLQYAKIANIIETLKQAKQHYGLVVATNPDTQQQTLRGLFSLANISKQLDMNVLDDQLYAQSLSELHHRIEH